MLSLVADATVTPAAPAPRGEGSLDTAFQQWLNDLHNPGMPAAWAKSFRSSPCDLDHDQWKRAGEMTGLASAPPLLRHSAPPPLRSSLLTC